MRTREEPSSSSCGDDALGEGPLLSHRGAAMVFRPLSDNERVLSRATPVTSSRSSVTYRFLSDLGGFRRRCPGKAFAVPRSWEPKRGTTEKISASLRFRRAWGRVHAVADVPFEAAAAKWACSLVITPCSMRSSQTWPLAACTRAPILARVSCRTCRPRRSPPSSGWPPSWAWGSRRRRRSRPSPTLGHGRTRRGGTPPWRRVRQHSGRAPGPWVARRVVRGRTRPISRHATQGHYR
jgi:hypothetical protein